MQHLANVCNRIPSLDLTATADRDAYANDEVVEIEVVMARADVEDDDDLRVFSRPVFA